MVSLDGFIEDANKKIDWHVWDKEMDKYMNGFLDKIDIILLGRVAYQLMESYWPTAEAEDSLITEKMNTLQKIVFSKTLKEAHWNNTTVIRENITEEIARLKQLPGKNLVIFGGADIISTFMRLSLFDEFHIIVNPVVLGSGTPLFKNIDDKQNLRLLKTHSFKCGNTVLSYEPLK